jgi:hypothetical protein
MYKLKQREAKALVDQMVIRPEKPGGETTQFTSNKHPLCLQGF